MSLEQRLRLLRGQTPQAPPASARGGGLRERLRRRTPDARRSIQSNASDEQALADALGAECLSPGVLRVQRHFKLDSRRGRSRISDGLSALPDLIDMPVGHPSKWLFLDTETSGLSGGTGTWAFLCGLLRLHAHGLWLQQYLLTRLDAEHVYLEAIASELETARLLVTYNGKSFDGPLLTTRLRLAGLSIAFTGKPHLDLLRPMRRAFARVWPDCRLATAEKRLLGIEREGDLSGAEAPAAWLAWLRRGEVEGLTAVMRHNRRDLMSLPALAQPLKQSLVDPRSTGADVHSVARLHLSRGDADLAFALLQANSDVLASPGLLELACLYRRRGEWSAAGAIWGPLAEQGIPEAIEAQAKYQEHRVGDYSAALHLARCLPASPKTERRCRRLEAKLRVCHPDPNAVEELA